MQRTCPKCQSLSAWLIVDGYDVVMRCLCGYWKVVATKLQQLEMVEDDEDDHELKLPKVGTNLYVTLMVAAALEKANSAEITTRLQEFGFPQFTVSDVSSYLTILRSKGLVDPIIKRRGMPGGSTWELTQQCIFLVGV